MRTKNKIFAFIIVLSIFVISRLDYGTRRQPAAAVKNIPAVSDSAPELISAPIAEKQNNYVPVARVIDGDTIVAKIGGQDIHVRLIGINSPELNDKRANISCLARKAKEEAQKILNGAEIYLEKDSTQGDYDKYGRMLAYVFLPPDSTSLTVSGTNFNKLMIEEGYAYEYTYRLPYKYQKEFKAAQNRARESQKGLWNPNSCN